MQIALGHSAGGHSAFVLGLTGRYAPEAGAGRHGTRGVTLSSADPCIRLLENGAASITSS